MDHRYSIGYVAPEVKRERRAAFQAAWDSRHPEPVRPDEWRRVHPRPAKSQEAALEKWWKLFDGVRERHNLWKDRREEELYPVLRTPSGPIQRRLKALQAHRSTPEGRLTLQQRRERKQAEERRLEASMKRGDIHRRQSMVAHGKHLDRYCKSTCESFAIKSGALWLSEEQLDEALPAWSITSRNKRLMERLRGHLTDMYFRCERRCFDAATGKTYRKVRGWEQTGKPAPSKVRELEQAALKQALDCIEHPWKCEQAAGEPMPESAATFKRRVVSLTVDEQKRRRGKRDVRKAKREARERYLADEAEM